jgi:ASCH domain
VRDHGRCPEYLRDENGKPLVEVNERLGKSYPLRCPNEPDTDVDPEWFELAKIFGEDHLGPPWAVPNPLNYCAEHLVRYKSYIRGPVSARVVLDFTGASDTAHDQREMLIREAAGRHEFHRRSHRHFHPHAVDIPFAVEAMAPTAWPKFRKPPTLASLRAAENKAESKLSKPRVSSSRVSSSRVSSARLGKAGEPTMVDLLPATDPPVAALSLADIEALGLPDEVLCLALDQPYADLVIDGVKTLETRTWPWPYQPSWLAVYATKKAPERLTMIRLRERLVRRSMVQGAILGIVWVTGSRAMAPEDAEAACYAHEPGRVAWPLARPHRFVRPDQTHLARGPQKFVRIPRSVVVAGLLGTSEGGAP